MVENPEWKYVNVKQTLNILKALGTLTLTSDMVLEWGYLVLVGIRLTGYPAVDIDNPVFSNINRQFRRKI